MSELTLEEATPDQLLDELMGRCDAAVFVGYRHPPGDTFPETFGQRTGPTPFCEGLIRDALRRCISDQMESEEEYE